VATVSRRGRITAHQSKVTLAGHNRATESAARVKEEVAVPIARQRQFQFELVLGRNIARDIAILPNLA
jgi:hypothetical protein